MKTISKLTAALSFPAMALASCANAESGESGATAETSPYTVTEMGTFDRPWAIEFVPGTTVLAITEKAGELKLLNALTKKVTSVSGVPEVEYKGQGGLGDIAFLESEADKPLDGRTIYLSYAEASTSGDKAGAALGRGKLSCDEAGEDCAIAGFQVIWRQFPKVTGRGHYSHRIQISPDGKYLFIASGDRQKQTPAQDNTNTMGTVVRLTLDGAPAAGNPFAEEGGVTKEIWSYGHRNILGMDFAPDGKLWEVEHGPAGGDELNLVKRANNYGWPTRSNGDNYNGKDIPDHTEDDGFTKPAIHWTPVIAPGDMIIYSGDMFGPWKGQALIAGLASKALVRVSLDGEKATEEARYDLGGRLRSVEQSSDGSIWVVQDGEDAKLFWLSIPPVVEPPIKLSQSSD